MRYYGEHTKGCQCETCIDRCAHCGMPYHVRENCVWAKESDAELERERLRRAEKLLDIFHTNFPPDRKGL